MSDKCREAWEKWIDADDYTEEEIDFGRNTSSRQWRRLLPFTPDTTQGQSQVWRKFLKSCSLALRMSLMKVNG